MILFISRKYPPSIGGMQRFSYHLNQELSRRVEVHPIVWGRSQLGLPLFLAYVFLAGAIQLLRRRAQLIYLADAVLAPLGLVLKALSRRPLVVTAHGLDVTWDNALYQALIPACLRRADRVICDCRYTESECIRRGLAPERCFVVPLGVEPYQEELPPKPAAKRALEELTGVNLDGKKVLLSVGRLVRRKGLAEFIGQVLPGIVAGCPSAHYIVVGEGQERPHIQQAIREVGLEGKVSVLGRLSDEEVQIAYRAADLLVMPNLPVKDDVEGFGLVALEAAAAGLCVVASRVQGLLEALQEGQNGYLIDPHDSEGYAQIILKLLGDDRAREDFARSAQHFTLERYTWARTAEGYMAAFHSLLDKR